MINRLLIALSLTLIALLSVATNFAQSEENDALIYTGEEIMRITPDGIGEPIALPEDAQGIVYGNTFYNMTLTPDERYFVFAREENNGQGFTAHVYIADLQEGTCCVTVAPPEDKAWEIANIGGVSPDGKQVFINYLTAYSNDFDGLLAILDVESGEIVHSFDPYEQFNTYAAFFINWNEDGIELVPTCFPCGAWPDGPTTLWNPETDAITNDYGYSVSLLGSVLGNGEILMEKQNEDYPIGNADVMVGPFNVVELSTLENPEQGEVIYHNPDNLNIIDPEWIMDGQAYIIQQQFGEKATIVWRDGSENNLTYTTGSIFIAGMPDGWLMTNFAGTQLYQYQWVDGAAQVTLLGEFENPVKLLAKPVLGEDITEPITPHIILEA